MPVQADNPIIKLDCPDPDVIRVGDIYYMVSTTMYFMPGCEILRSYDLIHWEHAAFVYDRLDSTEGQRLEGSENIYGKGMWAASMRCHKGRFYICFVCNDTGKTYLYTSAMIEGPWEKHTVEGFYHDCSILFDDDDKIYIVYGNRDIYLTQLKPDLSGPLEGGLHRLVVSDRGSRFLGYEGSHFYKLNGKYYLFFIHSLRDRWMRAEACFMADSLEGKFTGGDVLADDMGYCGQGVAQGGIVDTPDGKWYAVLFQDRGAVGRIPVLIPITWEDDWPVFGRQTRDAEVTEREKAADAAAEKTADAEAEKTTGFGTEKSGGMATEKAADDRLQPVVVRGIAPHTVETITTRPGYIYEPLVQSDDFKGPAAEDNISPAERKRRYGCFGLKSCWQFNHEPELSLVRLDRARGVFRVSTDKLCGDLTQAKNVLTQRMLFPGCAGEVSVDISHIKEGDYAGLCALQGRYGMVAATRRGGRNWIVMKSMDPDRKEGPQAAEWESAEFNSNIVRLKIEVNFRDMRDESDYFYHDGNGWKKIGITHKLRFGLDHFTGCRFGLFLYSTQEAGGRAEFMDFVYSPALRTASYSAPGIP